MSCDIFVFRISKVSKSQIENMPKKYKNNQENITLQKSMTSTILTALSSELIVFHLKNATITNTNNITKNFTCKRKNTIMLHFVAVIIGSSFSAVSLLNSNLFQWPVFGMVLSKFHRQMFRNKRFFSVVLLEVQYDLVFILDFAIPFSVVLPANVFGVCVQHLKCSKFKSSNSIM